MRPDIFYLFVVAANIHGVRSAERIHICSSSFVGLVWNAPRAFRVSPASSGSCLTSNGTTQGITVSQRLSGLSTFREDCYPATHPNIVHSRLGKRGTETCTVTQRG